VADGPLIEAVSAQPRRVAELSAIKGFPNRLAKDEGPELLDRLRKVEQAPESELRPYPRKPRSGHGRASPEVEELADRIKSIRNRRAEELGLPRGALLANATVVEVARAAPSTRPQLMEVEGMREWKADALADEILEAIRRTV
jgi:ribonuclease D